MKILGIKEGHDGAIALVADGELLYSLEAEKDSFPRCCGITGELLQKAAELSPSQPDVVAIGGWTKGRYSSERASLSGYFGIADRGISLKETKFFGKPVRLFSSTHERSHIWGAYGMSPFREGEPCHVLVWEGNIGNFYRIGSDLSIIDYGRVLEDPGNKYTFLYSLADTASPSQLGFWDTSHPGKLMALAAYGRRGSMTPGEVAVTDFILSRNPIMTTTTKSDLSWSPYHNIGIESQEFKDLAAKFSDRIYTMFFDFASRNLEPGLPLLISGGCGLNCEWNSKWRECGLFADVFVPPCCNDSGSAIGTAVDAMRALTGRAKLAWSVYAGEEFVEDAAPPSAQFQQAPFDPAGIAHRLASGSVVAWVEGRYEIGPRALGHRSLLAAPFNEATRERLNKIKKREHFRPIAPLCLESRMKGEFEPDLPSPHMLYFYRVSNPNLRAVTHVDGSARVQTVNPLELPRLARVLEEFAIIGGSAVLCNTSLNFSGRGFVNRLSDLTEFSIANSIDEMVVNGTSFMTRL